MVRFLTAAASFSLAAEAAPKAPTAITNAVKASDRPRRFARFAFALFISSIRPAHQLSWPFLNAGRPCSATSKSPNRHEVTFLFFGATSCSGLIRMLDEYLREL